MKAESKHINLVLSLNGKQKLVHVEGAVNAVDEDDLFINADHETIKTAVKNLVENAVNYSPEHTTVAVGIGSGDDEVAIRVVDQGIGIPESSLDRIFERFYRVIPHVPAKQGVQDWVWPSPNIACRIAEALSPCGRVRGRDRPSPSPCLRHKRWKQRKLQGLRETYKLRKRIAWK